VITHHQVTPIPITQHIIDLVHAMADHEGMPDGIKIMNRHGIVLYDSSWIAGVDYEEDNDYYLEEDDSNDDDDDLDDEEYYDRVDPNELDDVQEEENQANPTAVNEANNNDDEAIQADNEEEEAVEIPAAEAEEDTKENQGQDEDITHISHYGRAVRVLERFCEVSSLNALGSETVLYNTTLALLIAQHISMFNDMVCNPAHKHFSFAQRYSIQAGIKKFGKDRANDSAFSEMKQLHQRLTFEPIHPNDVMDLEKERKVESLLFLEEKRDGRLKGRHCANGSTQHDYMTKEDASSPTVMTESIMITSTVEAAEGRDVMTMDIPNAFVQTGITYEDGDQRIVMVIW
jgi:hypothetical protein